MVIYNVYVSGINKMNFVFTPEKVDKRDSVFIQEKEEVHKINLVAISEEDKVQNCNNTLLTELIDTNKSFNERHEFFPPQIV